MPENWNRNGQLTSLHVIVGALVQKLNFQDGIRSYLLAVSQFSKKPGIFARDMEAKFFI